MILTILIARLIASTVLALLLGRAIHHANTLEHSPDQLVNTHGAVVAGSAHGSEK